MAAKIETAQSLESELARTNKFGWAAYLFMKYISLEPRTPERDDLIKAIWGLLSDEAQATIRKIRTAK